MLAPAILLRRIAERRNQMTKPRTLEEVDAEVDMLDSNSPPSLMLWWVLKTLIILGVVLERAIRGEERL